MTFKYNNVYINETSTVVGPYEAKGPFSKLYDKTYKDLYFNEKRRLCRLFLYTVCYEVF